MNTRIRLILIVALLGISVVVLAVALAHCWRPPAPTTTPSNSAMAESTASSRATYAPGTSYPYPTAPCCTPAPTIPLSDFAVTVTITATATELQVNDVITVFFRLTNIGKLVFRKPYCYSNAKVDGDLPLTEAFAPVGPVPLWEMNNNLAPGQSFQNNIVVQAIRPATATWAIRCNGGVNVVVNSTTEMVKAEESTPLVLYIYPADPDE